MRRFTPFALLFGLAVLPLGCTDQEDVLDENAEARQTQMEATADGVVTEDEADEIEDEMEDAAAVNEDVREGDVIEGDGLIDGGAIDGNAADAPDLDAGNAVLNSDG